MLHHLPRIDGLRRINADQPNGADSETDERIAVNHSLNDLSRRRTRGGQEDAEQSDDQTDRPSSSRVHKLVVLHASLLPNDRVRLGLSKRVITRKPRHFAVDWDQGRRQRRAG